MSNKEIIAKIKAEIERISSRAMNEEGQDICEYLLSFLSTLESEKPINPEDAMKELDEKIALVKQRGTWDGVDVDKYMDEVRGREPEKPMNQDEELNEEIKRFAAEYDYERSEDILLIAIVARHFAQWGAEHAKIDVTDFCKPIDPGIAQCIADHSWEMLGEDEKPVPNDLEEAARHSEILTYPMPEDGDIEKVFKVQEARVFHEIGFIAGAKWQKEQMMQEAVKWLVDDDYHDLSEKGRFILGSVGLGYNGYYIPYSDLLKLPKEDEK